MYTFLKDKDNNITFNFFDGKNFISMKNGDKVFLRIFSKSEFGIDGYKEKIYENLSGVLNIKEKSGYESNIYTVEFISKNITLILSQRYTNIYNVIPDKEEFLKGLTSILHFKNLFIYPENFKSLGITQEYIDIFSNLIVKESKLYHKKNYDKSFNRLTTNFNSILFSEEFTEELKKVILEVGANIEIKYSMISLNARIYRQSVMHCCGANILYGFGFSDEERVYNELSSEHQIIFLNILKKALSSVLLQYPHHIFYIALNQKIASLIFEDNQYIKDFNLLELPEFLNYKSKNNIRVFYTYAEKSIWKDKANYLRKYNEIK